MLVAWYGLIRAWYEYRNSYYVKSNATMPAQYTADIEVAPINGEYLVLCQCGRTERHKQDTHVFLLSVLKVLMMYHKFPTPVWK